MIASIGPFWDANETWLVLGVGILLTAFPIAHGYILSNLYLPVFAMLIGLIFRGVAFDFRAKAKPHLKNRWNWAFFAGSLVTAFSQGAMLGLYIMGFKGGVEGNFFAILVGFAVCAGYLVMGATWMIYKCEGELQKKAIAWARKSWFGMVGGILLVSLTTPLVSGRIFDKWFSFPDFVLLMPIPLITGAALIGILSLTRILPLEKDRYAWAPFALCILVYVLCFHGLAYSFYPYIVPETLKIEAAAAAPESLMIIFVGACLVLPVLIGYTIFAYWVFRGKAQDLRYD
jgi:cytochrome d ubiquinol oxidase subunit II